MKPQRIVIIGGGVIGGFTAYFLAKAGRSVTLVDAGAFGEACSHGNCGLVCPGHIPPLARPGAMRQAMGALLKPRGPFRIKPRLDPALWSWLLDFSRHCNVDAMVRSGLARQTLLDSSMALYHTILTEHHLNCDFETRGCLYVYGSEKGMSAYAKLDAELRSTFGDRAGARRLDAAELIALEPALKPEVATGAYLHEHDGHLRPDHLMSGLRHVLESLGVEIIEQRRVVGLARTDRRTQAALTSTGSIPGDAFVIAAGAESPAFARDLGCRLPIQPGKGYSITMPRPKVCPNIPMIFQESKVAVTPWASGYRIGSTMEFAGYDRSIAPERIRLLTEGARHYLKDPEAEPVLETWYGWRPMTPDGLPRLGRSPALDNTWVAAGHNMVGISMGPASGRLMAELITGQTPHLDPTPFAPRP